MTREAAERWNARYQAGWQREKPQPRELLNLALPFLSQGGLILDAAMGLGVNAHWLVAHGFRVIGVDIASTAVFSAKRREPALMAVIADLEEFIFPDAVFSAVINFYYLNRKLLLGLPGILKPDGVAIIETLTVDMLEIKPDLPAEFLLQKSELPQLFSGWKILFYEEGWRPSDHGGRKSVARMIAQLPG